MLCETDDSDGCEQGNEAPSEVHRMFKGDYICLTQSMKG